MGATGGIREMPRVTEAARAGDSEALAALHRVFGYEAFRGEQEAVIDHVVAGGDAVVLMPTGGGKSLCYQIPSLVRPGTGIVVSPLIALMQDQVDALRALGVRAGFVNSTQDFDERRVVEAEFLAGELDLLYLGAGAAAARLDAGPAVARQDRGVRDRRGALRVPVGPRLPPRLSGPLAARRALAGRPADRAHGHGHARDAPGDHPAAEHADGPALRGELRPAQHPVPDRAEGGPEEAAARASCARSTRATRASCTASPASPWRRRPSS